MRKYFLTLNIILLLVVLTVSMSGCTLIFQKGRRVDVEKISKLKSELSEMERAKRELENRLKNEIDDKEVKVEMLEKGLVITFVAEVLFASGKAELKDRSLPKLDKVATVINTIARSMDVGIEGHTDNVPIKHSGWKSNWELSSARSLSVLHYMIKEKKVDPVRLSSTCYGRFKPIMSNDTVQGRQRNRRVEIVIIPEVQKKGR